MAKSATASRITLEPAFVLHRYDWSESSLIVEVFTRGHGRVALVAKGAKRPASNFRPVLLPMQPLKLTYSGESEVKTLKSAEWVGGYAMPTGNALLSGFYLNELMMRMLPRDDPHTDIFDLYAKAISVIAGNTGLTTVAVRAFELLLLQHMGWLPDLTRITQTQQTLHENENHIISMDAGLQAQSLEKAHGISGKHLLEFSGMTFPQLLVYLSHNSTVAQALKHQLRSHLNYHCGQLLRTPQMMSHFQQL